MKTLFALMLACGGLAVAGEANAADRADVRYHPLRLDPAKAGQPIKPQPRQVDIPLPVAELTAHFHADGGVRYECSADHAKASGPTPSAAASTEPQP